MSAVVHQETAPSSLSTPGDGYSCNCAKTSQRFSTLERSDCFGCHREGGETFVECAVRQLHEELSYDLPPERFEFLAAREGAESEVPGSAVRSQYFIKRAKLLLDAEGLTTHAARKAACSFGGPANALASDCPWRTERVHCILANLNRSRYPSFFPKCSSLNGN